MELVNPHGGTHHGYFLPAALAADRASPRPPAARKFRSGGILSVAVRIHLCHGFSARSLQHFSATLTLLRSADTRLARPKRKRND
jgi:hypothetical protein